MAFDWTAISPMVVPEWASLFNRAQGAVPTSMNSVQSMVQGGMNSPLMSQVINPAMQRLVQPQAQQRQQLTDAFRASGGLRGGQYGVRHNELANIQGQQQNDLMSQLIQQTLGPLLQAQLQEQQNSFLPAKAYTDILGAAKPTIFGSNNGAGAPGGAGGGGGGLSFLDQGPSIPGAGTGAMNPNYSGGGASMGPFGPTLNPQGGGMPGQPQGQPNDGYGPLDFNQGGGSGIAFNPVTGMYESQANQGQGAGQGGGNFLSQFGANLDYGAGYGKGTPDQSTGFTGFDDPGGYGLGEDWGF